MSKDPLPLSPEKILYIADFIWLRVLGRNPHERRSVLQPCTSLSTRGLIQQIYAGRFLAQALPCTRNSAPSSMERLSTTHIILSLVV